MDSNGKKVLIDVEIGDSESIKKLANLRKYSQDLKAAQKELDTSTEEGRQKFEQYTLEIQKNNAEIRALQTEIQKTEKANNAEAGSLEQLRAQLSLANVQYAKMGEERRKSAEGEELQHSIRETVDLLKEEEKAIGNTSRNVGNYEEAIGNVIGSGSEFQKSLQGIGSFLPGISKGLTGVTDKIVAMGKAVLANPLLAILAAVIAILLALKKTIETSKDATAKWNAILTPFNRIMQFLLSLVQKLVGWLLDGATAMMNFAMSTAKLLEKLPLVGKYIQDANKAIERSIELEKEKNALGKRTRDFTVESAKIERDVSELRAKADEKLNYTAEQRLAFIREANKLEKKSADESLAIAKQKLSIAEEEANQSERSKETEETLAQLRADVYKAETDHNNKMRTLNKNESSLLKEIASDQEDAAAKSKEAADKELEIQLKRISVAQRLATAMIQAEDDYQSEDFTKRQAYANKLFNLQQSAEIAKLNLQLKYGKIRKDEFDKENQILIAAQRQFLNEQSRLIEQHQDDMRKNLLSVLNHGIDQQIRDVEDKYAELVKSLGEIKLPEFTPGMDKDKFEKDYAEAEALILNNAYKEIELKKWLENEKAKIEKQRVENAAKDIEQIINDQYAGDLAKYTDNETEKLRIEIESLQKIIDEKKKAGLQTYEDEAELRGLLTSQNQLQLNLELGQKQLNAKQRYDLTKAMLEQEQLLYEGNAAKQLEIAKQIADNERQLLEERAKSFEEWSSATMNAMSALNDFVSNLESAQMQEYEDNNKKKKDDLKNRLDNGYITQKEYDAKTKELDKELEKQKAEQARKSAIREKAMNAFQIGIDTAMGIMKAVAAFPLTGGMPWVAFIAAIGAFQLAAVLSKPIPKAAKGKLIVGPSHAAGGTLIEAEGGESIINKRSTSMFAPLLSAINEAGGGVPFARPYADGGYVARNSSSAYQSRGITAGDVEAMITNAISQVKIYTTIEDIRKGDKNYSQIEDRASY